MPACVRLVWKRSSSRGCKAPKALEYRSTEKCPPHSRNNGTRLLRRAVLAADRASTAMGLSQELIEGRGRIHYSFRGYGLAGLDSRASTHGEHDMLRSLF
jgi:hypothetical protein